MILEVDISKDEIKHQLHPVKQTNVDFRLSLLTGKDKEQILERIETFNGIIQDENRLNDHWREYIEKQSDIYLNYWSPLSFVKNRYLRGILRRFAGDMLNKKGLSLYLNLMRCEAHRNMSIGVISNQNKYKKNGFI